ncbi:hypothetical protein SARC_07111 [Sphaeroforma arctica JP610]|uniref:Prefoldin subunit 4 n=1 Tax=Sphaeroforma arctica JP610 TaxID=667725 RepID=A0A0L0FV77_9EUKA|nr:hypothetical protein SARC_07111 [Sphaeroforma arctica JP610]KNC80539.1 hypothetical protein SARC_07111 [Sphaeroforma arctica JP610]|eukprot:XP_014154441.1 hypothetical protein SARC_07111 [Sphaeroforma arctica JP610]
MAATEQAEVEVTWEDQRMINTFSRLTSNMSDLEKDLEVKTRQKKNLEDAESDLMMIMDDEELVPFRIGDVYIEVSQSDATERLEYIQMQLNEDTEAVEEKMTSIRKELTKLKTQLYGKFGNNINLEAD